MHLLISRASTGTRSANDVSSRQLSSFPDRIRHTNDRAVHDFWVRQQNSLEFWGSYLEASDFDQFLRFGAVSEVSAETVVLSSRRALTFFRSTI